MNDTLALSINTAWAIDLGKVTDALAHSTLDGDPTTHPAALGELETVFKGSPWTSLAAKLS